MKEIELYIDEKGEWIERISLVEEPAIEMDFMKFGKEKLFFADAEKRIITGAVMIPEKRMWRNSNGGCYVYFSKDTVEKCAHRFLMEGKNKQFNLGHSTDTDKVSIVESWLKVSEADKSSALGFTNVPVGTWFISCKVESPEIWGEIKSGEFNGFSIEGVFQYDDETEVIREAEEFLGGF